jgi:Putative auto-transporter adhesin, head GIN domain
MSASFRLILPMMCAAFADCMVVNMATPIVGSGIAKSENRSISEVTRIRLNNVGTLTLKQSDKESLTVKGDDNIVPMMESAVAGGTLTLGIANNVSVQPKTPIEYIIEVKSLASLQITGAATANLSALDGKTLVLTVAGACKSTLQGKVDSLQLSATGASSINAAELACKKATVTVTGASNATVNANESLDITATGACAVTYLGDPKVNKSVAGASTVKKR